MAINSSPPKGDSATRCMTAWLSVASPGDPASAARAARNPISTYTTPLQVNPNRPRATRAGLASWTASRAESATRSVCVVNVDDAFAIQHPEARMGPGTQRALINDVTRLVVLALLSAFGFLALALI